MIIEYLSDFNCPYSYIGLNRIKNICNELNLDVKWEMKSFELEPGLSNIPVSSVEMQLEMNYPSKIVKKKLKN